MKDIELLETSGKRNCTQDLIEILEKFKNE